MCSVEDNVAVEDDVAVEGAEEEDEEYVVTFTKVSMYH